MRDSPTSLTDLIAKLSFLIELLGTLLAAAKDIRCDDGFGVSAVAGAAADAAAGAVLRGVAFIADLI